MPEIIQGKWDDLVARHDLRGRTVRVVVLDREQDHPWLKMLQAWADSHQPAGHSIDDSRESIYSGTADDPR
jgi:hypothetical protein